MIEDLYEVASLFRVLEILFPLLKGTRNSTLVNTEAQLSMPKLYYINLPSTKHTPKSH